jgi:hypothetical protein
MYIQGLFVNRHRGRSRQPPCGFVNSRPHRGLRFVRACGMHAHSVSKAAHHHQVDRGPCNPCGCCSPTACGRPRAACLQRTGAAGRSSWMPSLSLIIYLLHVGDRVGRPNLEQDGLASQTLDEDRETGCDTRHTQRRVIWNAGASLRWKLLSIQRDIQRFVATRLSGSLSRMSVVRYRLNDLSRSRSPRGRAVRHQPGPSPNP